MVLINYAGREINAKIVYYGPGLSGKTTNLECIYASVPSNSRGKMVSMKTRQDRTLFFDFLPLELGEVHGFRTRFLLYTVPGQVFYNATRKLVLKGADAVVFVADSGLGKMDENQESLRNLEENLREQGLAIENLPFVLQYNKRDLPQVYSVQELESGLNPRGIPSFEAAAASGQGVYETLHAVSRLLFQRLMNDLRPQQGRQAASPPAVTPPVAAPQRAAVPQRPALAASPQVAVPAGVAAQRPALGGVHPGYQPAQPQAAHPQASGGGSGPQVRRPQAPAHAPQAEAPQRWKGALDPSVLTVTPQQQPEVFEAEPAAPRAPFFGTASGLPPAPTPAQILDSVQASAESLETLEENAPSGDYSSYGHIVDLAGAAPQAAAKPNDGFIKDPLRRTEAPKGAPVAASGIRTQHVTVVVSKADLKPGSLRIVLDIKIEP
jgi:signal recognition particle receptor subunit beta